MKSFNIFIGDLFKVNKKYPYIHNIHNIINTNKKCTTITELRSAQHEYDYICNYFERIE